MNYWKIKKGEGAVWKEQTPPDFTEEAKRPHFEHYTYAITEEGSELDKKYEKEMRDNLPW
jgi:hypothetical protein